PWQRFRERSDREGEERRSAHCEDVVERIRRRDRAVVLGIVDKRGKEVDREDERAPVVESVYGRVVGGGEPDQQILFLGRHDPGEGPLEPRRRVLCGATPGRCEIGELQLHLWSTVAPWFRLAAARPITLLRPLDRSVDEVAPLRRGAVVTADVLLNVPSS